MDGWDPDVYERFRVERTRAFLDLLGLVQPAEGMRCADLGCGTGELTRRLHDVLRAASTIGLDNSTAMLERAAPLATGGLTFLAGDIGVFPEGGEPFDLVFSNSALGWLRDHDEILARWTSALTARGQLAVQLPARTNRVWETCAEEIGRSAPFVDALGPAVSLASDALSVTQYSQVLAKLGYREQHVRLQVYGHWLSGPEDVVTWADGAMLSGYRARLGPTLYANFLEIYRASLLTQVEDARPFFFPFERVLFWARR